MVNSINQLKRIDIIDRELSNKDRVKTKYLQKAIERECGNKVSLKTIQNDLLHLEINFSAPVEKDSKTKSYYYSDPNFTIKAFGLKEEDIRTLLLYTKILDQYRGHEIFEKISKAVEKVIDTFKIRKELKELVQNRSLIQIEKAPIIKGVEYTPQIVSALEKKLKLEFDYGKFGEKKKTRKVIPILLKEDKHMWYLIGSDEKENEMRTFAIDRIENLRIFPENFEFQEFDSDEYFKHSFGITVFEGEPIEVVLSFSPEQGNYVKTLPIHITQKELVSNKKEYRISVNVKPSYEFYSKILSYGPDVKIVSPEIVANEVKKRLDEALKKYS